MLMKLNGLLFDTIEHENLNQQQRFLKKIFSGPRKSDDYRSM